jgi:hypothetical protein
MSPTRAARTRNSSASSSGTAEQLDEVAAPGAEKALGHLRCSWRNCDRRPRDAVAKTGCPCRGYQGRWGALTTARTVTSQDVLSMTISVRVSATGS